MLRKLTKLVTNNFGLKVLGAVLAVILWMVIVNVEDPNKSTSFTIPVQITQTEYLTDMGKTYEVMDNSDQITFVVTGQRSVIERLSASDFTAVANMENIDDTLTMVPIVVTYSYYNNQLEITKRSSYVLVNVENLVTQKFKVKAMAEGSPGKDCSVDGVMSSVKQVSVSGPESVVEQIASAEVMVDVTGAVKDTTSLQQIILRDVNGEEIPQDRLTLDQTETQVTAKIKMNKRVPLEFEVIGEPASGYRAHDLESSVTAVDLEGDPVILSALKTLQISAAQLNIAGVTGTVSAVIELQDYLPDGVSLAEGEPEDVTVTIPVEAQTTVDVEMPVENIDATGLANGLKLQFNSRTVIVHITGYRDELGQINGEDLSGSIDVSGLQAGTYNVAVKIDGVYANNATAITSVTLTGNGSSTDEGNHSTENNGSEG